MTPERRTPLRVLQICAPAEVGGLERVVQGLSQGLREAGHDVTVIAVVDPGADIASFRAPLDSAGVRVVRLDVPSRGYLMERREVARLMDELHPDIVHTHGYRPDLLHRGAARRRGIPMVNTLHGTSRMGGLSHLFEWVHERSLRSEEGVIAVSEPIQRLLASKGVPPDRLHLIPNAWSPNGAAVPRADARVRLGLGGDEVTAIGWVGRLVSIKAPEVFLQALALVPAGSWTACIIGDGPERAVSEALAVSLGLGDRVRFLGTVPDAGRLLSALDLYVLSSHSEGTPIALLEAMAAARPIVATAVGGVPSAITDGREGWLVPAASPPALASAIREAVSSPALARKRGERARERIARDFDAGVWIRRHEDAYRAAMLVSAAMRVSAAKARAR